MKKILVIRNDKLGDFVLSLPVFALLKASLPEVKLHALVPNYTADIASACQYIDDIVLDPGTQASFKQQQQLLKKIRSQQYDAAITLFSTTRIGLILLAAGIPYRVAPATKLAQLFYSTKLKQRRSRSEKPEFEYNLDLAKHFLQQHAFPVMELPAPPYLEFQEVPVKELHKKFCNSHNIASESKLYFIHPGSGGSANNLSLQQYAQLIINLKPTEPYHFIISCGPDEIEIAQALSTLIPQIPHDIYHSVNGLRAFAQHIQLADLFISGSTGPLHIAGALNRPTAAFYTRRRSATALRWQTLNSDTRRLAFSPPLEAEAEDMSRIDIPSAAQAINHKLLVS